MSNLIYSAKAVRIVKVSAKLSIAFLILGALAITVYFGPSLIYGIGLKNLYSDNSFNVNEFPQREETFYQPPFNPSLPTTPHLIIETLGINTPINEAELTDFEGALKKGVWRVSDFGDPFNRRKAVILVAHRFGYLVWSNDFRRKNSFFNLPKLEIGEEVEIIWDQRKYTYKVYNESEGEDIADYNADLILYTCKLINSPIRIFKYAKLEEI